MSSIADLGGCADRHLAYHLDPRNERSFHTYDRAGDLDKFSALDALAPTLLADHVRREHVVAMFSDNDGPYGALRVAIQRILDETAPDDNSFIDADLDSDHGSWGLVRAVLATSQSTRGINGSRVSKMLHRKRPGLVPLFDPTVARFYARSVDDPVPFWRALQADIRANRETAEGMAVGRTTPDYRPVTVIRAVDIAIWEHSVTSCTRGTA